MKTSHKVMFIVPIILGTLLALLPTILTSLGLHPEYTGRTDYQLPQKKALVLSTSHGILGPEGSTEGKATGLFASELTHAYYAFSDAGMAVDVASVKGGSIPIDPQSLEFPVVSKQDKRMLEDSILMAKVKNSIAVKDVEVSQYDVVFVAGGWGAAYDLAQSEDVAALISNAYYSERAPIIGSVCHGALALVNALDENGNKLIAGRTITGVTDKQIKELDITVTPMHPETELRKAGAKFVAQTKFVDFLATYVAVDEEQRFVSGQNQNSGLEASYKILELLEKR
ncbi:type 1 glutamine amidotransferase domain-containing protein [Paraferrimonas sp. SM1919]|uniref:type 1 glutamine amidotransferase domain-containing protein n=1 Tax=Paraferrimonas sp. SM1919 TaxID=2662263 RepID=UPI0013D58407|nr:type 1 glutamine amidotransferase domain-containing protein [Paraferrimonas sp. SM1919]